MPSPEKYIPEISPLQRWFLRRFLGSGEKGVARALTTLRNIWSLFLTNRTVQEYLKSAEAIRVYIDPNAVQAKRIKALKRLPIVRLVTAATVLAITAALLALLTSPAGNGSERAIPIRNYAARTGTADSGHITLLLGEWQGYVCGRSIGTITIMGTEPTLVGTIASIPTKFDLEPDGSAPKFTCRDDIDGILEWGRAQGPPPPKRILTSSFDGRVLRFVYDAGGNQPDAVQLQVVNANTMSGSMTEFPGLSVSYEKKP
jgi:hypothetical protein